MPPASLHPGKTPLLQSKLVVMRTSVFGLACMLCASTAFAADFKLLVGHGGPIMDAEVSTDGRYALTASFDNAVGYWTLGSDEV